MITNIRNNLEIRGIFGVDIHKFWEATLTQNQELLETFFCENAVIKWHCTNEQFTATEYIKANCYYPGSWDGVIERIEENGNNLNFVGKVYQTDKSASFHVVSFIKLKEDKIIAMDEYWSDDGDVPGWRKEMGIGREII